jgi:hypothetical protein
MSYNSDARIERLYEKFAEFKTKRDAYINSKNIYNENVKKYLEKGKNYDVKYATNGNNTGYLTKDNIFMETTTPLSNNDFCDLTGSNTTINDKESSTIPFDSNGILHGGNSGNLTNLPCNNFNELTQVGLDGYEYKQHHHDNTENLCFNRTNDKFDKAFFIKQKLSEGAKCVEDNLKECQSIAKFNDTDNNNGLYFGVGNQKLDNGNDSCYCYVSKKEVSNIPVNNEKIVDVYTFESTKTNPGNMLVFLMNGRLATFKSTDINSTHDGMFNSLDNDEPNYLTPEISEINAKCNSYVGQGPHSISVDFNTEKCIQTMNT